MDTEKVVVESANMAIGVVGTKLFADLTMNLLGLVGREISRHVRPGEDPGLFSPVDIVRDGKNRDGAILVLDDRAILGWTTGTLRIKNFEESIALASISEVSVVERPAKGIMKSRKTMTLQADEAWNLVFPGDGTFEGGKSIVPFLEFLLDGSAKLSFDDDGSWSLLIDENSPLLDEED